MLAFAGIGRPQKFLDSLQEVGAKVVEQRLFADHHAYREAELEALMAAAAKLDAIPVTTAKDAVRVPPGGCDKLRVLDVALAFDRPDELDGLLATLKRVRA